MVCAELEYTLVIIGNTSFIIAYPYSTTLIAVERIYAVLKNAPFAEYIILEILYSMQIFIDNVDSSVVYSYPDLVFRILFYCFHIVIRREYIRRILSGADVLPFVFANIIYPYTIIAIHPIVSVGINKHSILPGFDICGMNKLPVAMRYFFRLSVYQLKIAIGIE